MQTITVQTLKEHLPNMDAQKELIIDVRTPEEYRAGHIPGAVNREVGEIERHKEELNMYTTVYVHCRSGGRSAQACERLADIGLHNMVNIEGGVGAWESAGFEIEK